tara:strand:+ start:6850 stop:7443 length:594 start_codon:yes stop_codon:yes gene_type:complete
MNKVSLFAKHIGIFYLNIDTTKILHTIKKEKYYINHEYLKSEQSVSIEILNKPELFELKNKILNCFYQYKKEIYKIENDFIIPTSWVAKFKPKTSGTNHAHSNCMFSAVYYLDESSEIVFKNGLLNNLFCNPTEWNTNNCTYFEVKPKKNKLLIFPADVFHEIKPNLTNKTRYSIACNFFPVGKVGKNDSFVELQMV